MPVEEMGHRALPQPADVDNRIVLAVVGGFLLFVAAAIAGILLFLNAQVPGAFLPRMERRFPAPELQTSPQADLARFEAAQQARLSGYAWVDRDHNQARIPIDQAMQLVAGRGPQAYDAIGDHDAQPPPADGGKP
ncbi:hypothetical protein [Bradyrhizobium japonicum]|jgi:hypothetical protein|uniref:hypothetical protein n=1 Tax=Bradyrhizobium japonicum TaxID=375 RepID=UPI00271558AD|nr:hypothetical protein [Bradyrhizobium japonicum]WLB24392.1 hypothetical protein QIH95_48595 [Bradyrhizobium japonicum]